MSLPNAPHQPKILSTEPLYTAKWTKLVATKYTDPLGVERVWESCERTTRPDNMEIDGVGIIAILEAPGKEPELVLQKQYRPPVQKVCIEVPAGLIDPNETPEECAIRELREETGYYGEVVSVEVPGENNVGYGGERSCIMFNDPGFCNTNLNFVHLRVDLTDPRNQNPKQELEDEEFIEVFSLPLKDLYKKCREWEREGFAIDARIGTLAEGFEVARKWRFF